MRKLKSYFYNPKGATLIEMLAVLSIAAIVLSVGFTLYFSIQSFWQSNELNNELQARKNQLINQLQNHLFGLTRVDALEKGRILFMTQSEKFYALLHDEASATLMLSESDTFSDLLDQSYSNTVVISRQITQITMETVPGGLITFPTVFSNGEQLRLSLELAYERGPRHVAKKETIPISLKLLRIDPN